jgi:hypothetical protein
MKEVLQESTGCKSNSCGFDPCLDEFVTLSKSPCSTAASWKLDNALWQSIKFGSPVSKASMLTTTPKKYPHWSGWFSCAYTWGCDTKVNKRFGWHCHFARETQLPPQHRPATQKFFHETTKTCSLVSSLKDGTKKPDVNQTPWPTGPQHYLTML